MPASVSLYGDRIDVYEVVEEDADECQLLRIVRLLLCSIGSHAASTASEVSNCLRHGDSSVASCITKGSGRTGLNNASSFVELLCDWTTTVRGC